MNWVTERIYCSKCGAKLLIGKIPKGYFDPITGEEEFWTVARCPNSSFFSRGHDNLNEGSSVQYDCMT